MRDIMCPRLTRCFRALDGVGVVRKPGEHIVHDAKTIVQDSMQVATAFMQEHASLCSIEFVGVTSNTASGDMTNQPLDLADYDLLHTFIALEHFMRESVKALPAIRGIESDQISFTRPTDAALRWVMGMTYFGTCLRHTLSPDASEYIEVALQQIRLTPALDNFLQLASAVRSCQRVWDKKPPDYWSWPSLEKLEDADIDVFSPISDIVARLEAVQTLLKKQDASSDRIRRNNIASARTVVKRAFLMSSKLLAIRLDLGFEKGIFQGTTIFKKKHPPQGSQPNFNSIKKAFDAFALHLYKVFGRLDVEYVCKMEYAVKKGYHYHLLILLNGQKHQQDVTIAKMLGDYWVQVATGGQGIYWNCNAHKEVYQKCGIGMIHRNDEEKRKNLDTEVVPYLVKYDLPFQLLKVPGSRKFSTSKEKNKVR